MPKWFAKNTLTKIEIMNLLQIMSLHQLKMNENKGRFTTSREMNRYFKLLNKTKKLFGVYTYSGLEPIYGEFSYHFGVKLGMASEDVAKEIINNDIHHKILKEYDEIDKIDILELPPLTAEGQKRFIKIFEEQASTAFSILMPMNQYLPLQIARHNLFKGK